MEKMKKQRQKETAIVKRAMAELKSLREQVRSLAAFAAILAAFEVFVSCIDGG